MYGKVSRVSSHLIQFRVPALSEEAGPECVAGFENLNIPRVANDNMMKSGVSGGLGNSHA